MEREDLVLGEYSYEAVVHGILVKIREDALNEETVAYANKILDLYLSKKPEIIDYILNNGVLDFYGDVYSKDEIIEKLKEADIEIISNNWGTFTWLNCELDEHIISVEFGNDMKLTYVSIDG